MLSKNSKTEHKNLKTVILPGPRGSDHIKAFTHGTIQDMTLLQEHQQLQERQSLLSSPSQTSPLSSKKQPDDKGAPPLLPMKRLEY
ncbi:hypothetical protein AAY473_027236 [Plecturocebus cupreus]